MMKFSNSPVKGNRGSVLILTIFGAALVFGMLAVGVDLGNVFYQRARNQTAVNAGWKAGFDLMAHILEVTPGSIAASERQGDRDAITARVKDVMKANGYSDAELAGVTVKFSFDNRLEVFSRQQVGLFFARMFTNQPAAVSSIRGNLADPGSQDVTALIPLAIPHGVIKDLTRNEYTYTPFGDTGGFQSGREYILKLGSGEQHYDSEIPEPLPPAKKILIHMGQGQQTDTGYLKAYGAVFWCLNDTRLWDSGYNPVEWLLGYDGGSFMIPFADEVVAKLGAMGVAYEILQGDDAINAARAQAGRIESLSNRPRIGVYSNKSTEDPVEPVLKEAEIPYGTYFPDRSATYQGSLCTKSGDAEILAGALTNFNFLYVSNEDLTGFGGGCQNYFINCQGLLGVSGSPLGPSTTPADRASAKTRMCLYCSGKYDAVAGSFGGTYNPGLCTNMYTRCVDRRTASGTYYSTDLYTKDHLCVGNENPKCSGFNADIQNAATLGFSPDGGTNHKSQAVVTLIAPLSLTNSNYFTTMNAIQKMKSAVATKIYEHLQASGNVLARSAGAETLDLILFQKAIHQGTAVNQAYRETLGFENFLYKLFPYQWPYSTISDGATDQSQNWNILGETLSGKNVEPLCQAHTNSTDTGPGSMASMNKTYFKTRNTDTTILGYRSSDSNKLRYVKGFVAGGEFAMMGGSYLGGAPHYDNVAAKRLVLDNIIHASISRKILPGATTTAGRSKCNSGAVDPDNTTAGGANDYRDRFEYGFSGPLELGDRLVMESGNMAGPSDTAVNFHIYGDGTNPPNRHVIVPITDIPPEVPVNSPQNASATTIYDLQGQDHANGVYTPNQYAFGAAVRIIGFAEFVLESPDPSAPSETHFSRVGTDYQSGDSGDLGPYQSGQVRGRFVRYVVKPGDPPPPY